MHFGISLWKFITISPTKSKEKSLPLKKIIERKEMNINFFFLKILPFL